MTVEFILGVGVVSFLLLYISFNLDDEHVFLRVLFVLMTVFLLALVPKATLDNKAQCQMRTINETVQGNVTTLQYGEICNTTVPTTTNIFWNGYLWFIILLSGYVFLYLMYKGLNRLREANGR